MWNQEEFIVVSHWTNSTAPSTKVLLPILLIAAIDQSGIAQPATIIHLTHPLPGASRQLAVT